MKPLLLLFILIVSRLYSCDVIGQTWYMPFKVEFRENNKVVVAYNVTNYACHDNYISIWTPNAQYMNLRIKDNNIYRLENKEWIKIGYRDTEKDK